MFTFIYRLSISLLVFNVLAYILVVLREKILLKKNIILIDNKHITQEDINNTDVNEFIYKGVSVRSGDGIKIITKEKNTLDGIIIGANKSERAVHLITYENKVIKCTIKDIQKIKVIDKYGNFL